ncbi:MAG: NfeD family protein [Proteobacteria bacterium]|jgi:membrane protein implicated in regulation of membrane protease activity|nr:NfeD family protein [Ramlibacter sp.]MCA0213236.1 NfeD family protein [Pseudomonadota bacterium]
MSEPTVWWILAGAAVAVELLTGTFYLLMLAIGLAAAAVAAHTGASMPVQLVVAALVGGGAVAAWHFQRSRQPKGPPASANRDVNLDVGESVHIDAWHADGTATVKYRGASWTVIPAPGVVPGTGAHRVREVVGNRLVVEKA